VYKVIIMCYDQCEICFENIVGAVTELGCYHLFHPGCINDHIIQNISLVSLVDCPCCGQRLTNREYIPAVEDQSDKVEWGHIAEENRRRLDFECMRSAMDDLADIVSEMDAVPDSLHAENVFRVAPKARPHPNIPAHLSAPVPRERPVYELEDLLKKTVGDLRKIAKTLCLSRYAKMTKMCLARFIADYTARTVDAYNRPRLV